MKKTIKEFQDWRDKEHPYLNKTTGGIAVFLILSTILTIVSYWKFPNIFWGLLIATSFCWVLFLILVKLITDYLLKKYDKFLEIKMGGV